MDKPTKTIDENQCFYDDECIEFILDDLSEGNRSAIVRHTTTCQECADLLNDYMDFDKSLAGAGHINVASIPPMNVPQNTPGSDKTEPVDLIYTLTQWPLGISFYDDKTDPEELLSAHHKGRFRLHRDDNALTKIVTELNEYISGQRSTFDVPLDLRFATSDFHREVLQGTKNIPFGQYVSYGELAVRIGHPKAFRAVGGALGRNPIPIIVPCHRVMAGSGKIGGYTGGLHIKEKLMEIEGIRLGLF
jgi:methylated-DNA-[protein]-cysteine S-methyltransferase